MNTKPGYQTFTGAGYVGGSAIPVVIYGLIAHGASPDVWTLMEVEAGDWVLSDSYDATGVTMFPKGVVFPNGCWINDVGTRTTVLYQKLG